MFFVCKQMTAYDVRISDWSSDVCSSELADPIVQAAGPALPELPLVRDDPVAAPVRRPRHLVGEALLGGGQVPVEVLPAGDDLRLRRRPRPQLGPAGTGCERSEEHTSELQSLMRHSYAVFCLQKKTIQTTN